MVRSLAVVVAFALTTSLFAQPKDPPPKPEPKLKVGDPAPPLVVDKWLVGKEVKGYEKGTVYVVSFTNLSPPFAVALVELDELAARHAGKGLAVVGVHTIHARKPGDQGGEHHVRFATSFAKELGLSYPVAWGGDDTALWDAYVGKADSVAAFVIDPAGKVAYAGPVACAVHAAEKVLAGTWKGKADADAMTEAMAGVEKFMQGLGEKIAPGGEYNENSMKVLQDELKVLGKMLKDAPFLVSNVQVAGMRLSLHLLAKSYDVPDEMLTARIATATKRKSVTLLKDFFSALAAEPETPDPKLSKLVAKYTDAYAGLLDVKEAATSDDARTEWYRLIVVSTKHGNKAEAERYTKTLLAAVPEKNRKAVEQAIRQRLEDADFGR